ncbi:hypothetical protein GGR28_003805 [Lewinella aquimaris]|uniref:Uncharacterized protein n=1 Tax=Neolewinella aquimaris TaxID=1835722 RepID=A0A840ECE8_9BACT|nr:hypothetical protein [Neolewinella aquimaris]MBB4081157.1 hypothetical protein [Neolewinella aquimaris]
MRVSDILNQVNTFEKNNFLRVVDQIISEKPTNYKKIETILSQIDGQIKNADNLSVESVFGLVSNEYEKCIRSDFQTTTNQLDILVDILIRDGNSLMSREWLLKLYDKEVKSIKAKVKDLKALLASGDDDRVRDYNIYRSCVEIAYLNDEANNRDKKVTKDEQSILNVLIEGLDLSHEEVKLINYSVISIAKLEIDELISLLVKSGVIFYSKKTHQIFVPDEIVGILRKIRGKEVPDKIYNRVLKALKPSQVNLVARKHNIEFKLSQEEKAKHIIAEGIQFSKLLLTGIHKPGTKKTEKKKAVVDLIEKQLKVSDRIGGASLEDKVGNFIIYLNEKDREENISISIHGYDKLLQDAKSSIKDFASTIRAEFEIQDSVPLDAESLLSHNLKPLDILYSLNDESIKLFCEQKNISTRGDEIKNILENYRDVKNLYLENYIHISNRDVNSLRSNNIGIKESELGMQYEALTKHIFEDLKLHVDETLKKKLNTAKDQIDILINLGNEEIIVVECKTKKDKKFSTYSSASRQIKAYKSLAENAKYKVVKTFIVAPTFTDDFINECGLDYDLNLSLITSEALIEIHKAFQVSALDEFPYKILLRDVLIDSSRVVKAISK